MISAEKINCAEIAFRLVCDGADPVEVVSRCEINGLFERRDWVATIHGVGTVLGVVRQPEFDRLHKLCELLSQMCDKDRAEAHKLLESI